MPTDTRDTRAIQQIACPRCKVPAGKPCNLRPFGNRPPCHPQRRKANIERLRSL